jgi:hypothetical protein
VLIAGNGVVLARFGIHRNGPNGKPRPPLLNGRTDGMCAAFCFREVGNFISAPHPQFVQSLALGSLAVGWLGRGLIQIHSITTETRASAAI